MAKKSIEEQRKELELQLKELEIAQLQEELNQARTPTLLRKSKKVIHQSAWEDWGVLKMVLYTLMIMNVMKRTSK